MNSIRRLLLTLFLTSIAATSFAECLIPNRGGVAKALDAYLTCVDAGEQLAFNINSAISDRRLWRDDYLPAIKSFTAEIEAAEEPSEDLYMKRGLAYLGWGKERQAIKDFEAVNAAVPGYSAAHFYRGVAHLQKRRYETAIDAIETAMNLSAGGTSLAPMYFAKAKAQMTRRTRELALTTLAESISSDPTYAPAYFERALLRHKMGDEQLAIDDYSRYIDLRPDSAVAYYNRGLVYQDLRVDHLAIQDFNRAIELNPDYQKARATKGMTYLMPILPVLIVLMLG